MLNSGNIENIPEVAEDQDQDVKEEELNQSQHNPDK